MKHTILLISLLALLLFTGSWVTAMPTRASTTFAVNNVSDAPDANLGDGICRTSANTCTLRAAIQQANNLAGSDVISLPAGNYILTLPKTTKQTAASGDLDITGDLVITGAGVDSTNIDGNGIDRLFNVLNSAEVTISKVMIQHGNPGAAANGGGIYNSGSLTLTNVVVSGNGASSGYGGGIYNDGDLRLTDVTVMNNNTTLGGGIFNALNGTATLTDVTVSDNMASRGYGGGLYINSTARLTNVTVSSNTATLGGGIFNAINSRLTLTNSTISGNRASDTGGGIFVTDSSTMDLYNVTITNNTADSDKNGTGVGGGISALGTTTFRNSLLAGNRDGSGQAPDCWGRLVSQGYNVIQNSVGCTIDGVTAGNKTGQNPKLGSLQNNGGSTSTHALLPGSPALNAGNPAGCTDELGGPIRRDQRGVARPHGTACDIGAYEAQFNVSSIYLPVVFGSAR